MKVKIKTRTATVVCYNAATKKERICLIDIPPKCSATIKSIRRNKWVSLDDGEEVVEVKENGDRVTYADIVINNDGSIIGKLILNKEDIENE